VTYSQNKIYLLDSNQSIDATHSRSRLSTSEQQSNPRGMDVSENVGGYSAGSAIGIAPKGNWNGFKIEFIFIFVGMIF